jgi:putative membrane protein insertion efficiency factor
MKILFVTIIVFILIFPLEAVSQQSFKPWDTDVAVGDEDVHGPFASAYASNDIATCCSGAVGVDRGVNDAFTGGALLLIRVFQIWISPQDGPSCRFRPTCSAYGKIAVQKHGAFLGGVLAGERILRCNIFSKPGDDPVPDKIFQK